MDPQKLNQIAHKTNVIQHDDNYQTDLKRWRLKVAEGRNCWYYLSEEEIKKSPQTMVEKHHLGLVTEKDCPQFEKAKTPLEAAEHGLDYFQLTQTEDGHWACQYGGPMFLLPGLVISLYVTESLHYLEQAQRKEIIRYLFGLQKEEGGWGIHVEAPSTMFGTALNYCVLRILGIDSDHPRMIRARAFIHRHGGAVGTPSWGKFWLAALNVYDWEGLHPISPELWIFPDWFPAHPGRFWCHCRQVYLPMSYVYGKRIKAKETELIKQLRQELYVEPYENINWYRCRSNVAAIDLYTPHTTLLEFLYKILHFVEKFLPSFVRKLSLNQVAYLVKAEDDNTKCIGIGPVSKVINTVVAWDLNGTGSKWFLGHMDRVRDYLWISENGMMMNGTNGVQLWDTAFAIQAILESGLEKHDKFKPCVQKAYDFLDLTQVKENVPNHDKVYRMASKGAFPFSTRDCGWIVSDCTAEGLKSIIYLHHRSFIKRTISDERIMDGINVLLYMQNDDGGYGSYENRRASEMLELINPSEVFGKIMVEYSYVECTSASIQGISTFKKYYPDYRKKDVDLCIQRGVDCIKKIQRQDGSWYGCWGVCFTYGTWFGIEGLALTGGTYENSHHQKKACEFLISKQREDGGWGESFKSCETEKYCENLKSQVVNTCWAVMGLMAAKYPNKEPIKKGIKFIMNEQLPNGNWKLESIMGIFNKNCTIDYPNYQNYFPIWALGRYAQIYGNENF